MSTTEHLPHALLAAALAALLAAAAVPQPAAAETLTCTAITTLPAVISTQGTYCLKQDLGTAVASGVAIDIQANNVTLDCNGYKLGGLAAGAGTQTLGVHALARHNTIVRNCHIRGFQMGIALEDTVLPYPVGTVVEDNRLDGNTRRGIWVAGEGGVIRRNLVHDTGGNTLGHTAVGILVNGGVDVLDNTVDGVDGGGLNANGIFLANNSPVVGVVIADNRVRDIFSTGFAVGIHAFGSNEVLIRDNSLANPYSDAGDDHAIVCDVVGYPIGNAAIGFEIGAEACWPGHGNTYLPYPVGPG